MIKHCNPITEKCGVLLFLNPSTALLISSVTRQVGLEFRIKTNLVSKGDWVEIQNHTWFLHLLHPEKCELEQEHIGPHLPSAFQLPWFLHLFYFWYIVPSVNSDSHENINLPKMMVAWTYYDMENHSFCLVNFEFDVEKADSISITHLGRNYLREIGSESEVFR